MPIITTTRKSNPVTLHDGAGYAPHKVGNWVATDQRDLPWNTIGTALEGSVGKGTKKDHLMTAAEVMAATGMDRYNVEKFPLFDHNGKAIPRLFATGYDDPDTHDRKYFAAVSDRYEVVNAGETLGFFDEVVNLIDGSHYSAGWVMAEKSMMGLTIELPQEIVVDPKGANDRTGLHFLGVNSFDGSTGLQGAMVGTRWFCMNQMAPAIRSAKRRFSLRHTKNVKNRVMDAQRMVETLMGYAKELDGIANSLYKAKMGDRALESFLNNFEPFHLGSGESDLIKARVTERREELMSVWRAPHNENITGTKWGAVNLVAEFAEWGRTVKGSTRTGTNPTRQRAIGTLVHPTPEGMVTEAVRLLVG